MSQTKDPGFLVVVLKVGEAMTIGDALILCKEIEGKQVRVAIKADRKIPIQRLTFSNEKAKK